MKIVCISDTHSKHNLLKDIPDGDVIIHAGDISSVGNNYEIVNFTKWFLKLPHKHKIVVPGNHDFFFERNINNPSENMTMIKEALPDPIIYLKDDEVTIDGIKFWGSPYTPKFFSWAFMLERGEELRKHWEKIPEDTDVLITHGPPKNILDRCNNDGFHAGCEELLSKIKTIKPKCHIFGHIHEGYGKLTIDGVTYINASVLDDKYYMTNKPIVIEV